jgi:hypothetical protein
MYQVKDMETIHIYYEEEQPPKDYTWLIAASLFCVFLAGLIGSYYLCSLPQTITVPAIFSTRQYSASVPIIPTGKKDIPPTQATGSITIYNGSMFAQSLPKDFILTTAEGIELITDASIAIPPGNPPTYGTATVSAHAVVGGGAGNIAPFAINQNYGGALYIRNLTPFTGGKEGYSVPVITSQDIQTARDTASTNAFTFVSQQSLAFCRKTEKVTTTVTITFSCEYITYKTPANVQVVSEKIVGKQVVLTVRFMVPLHRGRIVI